MVKKDDVEGSLGVEEKNDFISNKQVNGDGLYPSTVTGQSSAPPIENEIRSSSLEINTQWMSASNEKAVVDK